ncbi:MAG: hypothetical protein EAZ53_01570 [Bacteroidetes bacterium]|nr:MAG: hypothetical protein EAZ53_01570 [Bacteroidota bacterium]
MKISRFFNIGFIFISIQMTMAQTNFGTEWKQVEKFQTQNLPKSALEKVNAIYAKAKTENEVSQMVKALVYRLSIEEQIGEAQSENIEDYSSFRVNKALKELDKELLSATNPVHQSVLHLLKGKTVSEFYSQNSWRIQQRTALAEYSPKDISSWSEKNLAESFVHEFNEALKYPEKLKSFKISEFEGMVVKGENTRKLRPTLLELIGFYVIQSYQGNAFSLAQPTNPFKMDNESYFLLDNEFISLKINTEDTLSFVYKAIKTYQTLMQENISSLEVLSDIELHKVQYVNSNYKGAEKEKHFQLALEKLQEKYKKLPIYTEIVATLAAIYTQRAAKYNPLLSDKFKWENKKALELCEEAVKLYPESYGYNSCQAIIYQIKTQEFSIETEKVILPNQPFRVLATVKNTSSLTAYIYQTTYDELEKLSVDLYNQYYKDYKINIDQELYKYYESKAIFKKQTFAIPDDKDYQNHKLELALEPLKSGVYMIFWSSDSELKKSKLVKFNYLQVTNIAYIHKTEQPISSYNINKFYVINRSNGGVPDNIIEAELRNLIYEKNKYKVERLNRYLSDAKGYFEISNPFKTQFKSPNNESYYIIFKNRGDEYSTFDYFRLLENIYHSYMEYYSSTNYTNTQSFIFTDRAIYRPGQTVYFKTILIQTNEKGDKKLLKKYPIRAVLRDVNYQEISVLENLETNDFGSASGTFVLPSGGLTGNFTIDLGYGSTNISVEEYKRPKFEVLLKNPEESFRLNDEIKIKGNANALAGFGISNAKVVYKIQRAAIYPQWLYWRWRCWGYYPTSPSAEIKFGEAKTNDKGEFEILFKAIPDADVEDENTASFNYTITADVTDENGETRSATNTILVSKQALQISTDLKERLEINENKKFSLKTQNMSGFKQKALVNVKVYLLTPPDAMKRTRLWARPDKYTLLESDYQKLFPTDEYKNELDIINWKQEKIVLEKSFDTEKDTVLDFGFLSKVGKYYFIATAKDKYGVDVKEERFFDYYDKNEKQLAIPSMADFNAIKAEVEIGDNAQIKMGTSASNQNIFTQLTYKDKAIDQWISLNNEVKIKSLPMTEATKQGMTWKYIFVRNNRKYEGSFSFFAPSESPISAEFITFRDKLQPAQKESWKIKFKDRKGKSVLPEVLAGMYDASLDQFKSHSMYFALSDNYYHNENVDWICNDKFGAEGLPKSIVWKSDFYPSNSKYKSYDGLDFFGYNLNSYRNRVSRSSYSAAGAASSVNIRGVGSKAEYEESESMADMALSATPTAAPMMKAKKEAGGNDDKNDKKLSPQKPEESKPAPTVRKNLQETAFFFPHLETDSSGAVILNFTAPEALTKWRLLGLAHTKDLKYGTFENTCVTQKELMILPNAPRFFRENDEIRFPAKVVALQNDIKNAEVKLLLFDALTMKPIDAEFGNISSTQTIDLQKGVSKGVYWKLKIPVGISAVVYRVTVQAGNQSDGEENALPVLTNAMLVTESLPLSIRGNKIKKYTLENLKNNTSTTLRHHNFTLEFTPNPAWYAVQALPYLMEYPYECSEQLFSRFYSNTMASYIANSNPKIKQVFDTWKNYQPDALISNLEKNQELKALIIEETPWLRNAKDETEQKRRIALLFDLNRIADEKSRTIEKLKKRQVPSGAFPWFDGMHEDRYMTQHLVCGMGKLQKLGMINLDNEGITDMTTHALDFIDSQILKDYKELLRYKTDLEKHQPSDFFIHYIYTRTFFKTHKPEFLTTKEFKYFQKQAVKFAMQYGKYSQAMLGLAQHRMDDKITPQKVVKSLNEWALHSEEMGMYWKETAGYYWYEAPIERQAMMIEFYDEAINDQKSVDELKVWLLKQKQTTHWKTTKATTEAIYALLLKGTDFLANEPQVEITVGNEKIDPKKAQKSKLETSTEAGTGYFKTSWQGNEITKEMANITIDKKDAGVSWGAVYWQYFEQLDKIKQEAQNPIKLTKKLFLLENTAGGEVLKPINDKNTLKPGDLVKVRIEIKSDRNMEYVHLKDMRAAGFEPVNVLSQYKYQDGLGYYESTRDAATNFFIGYMPLGSYVFEYAVRVQHVGNFSNGVTSIQCMYAPEFGSHSEGMRVKVGE